jgi:hypothetical protein
MSITFRWRTTQGFHDYSTAVADERRKLTTLTAKKFYPRRRVQQVIADLGD